MTFLAVAARAGTGGHPAWHAGVLAGASVVAFLAVRVHELWSRRARTRRTMAPEGLVVTLGLASVGAGLIHAAVCPAHFREATVFGVFFAVSALLQVVWAALVLRRPDRVVLLAGIAGNGCVLLLWLLTRTAGLPIGPDVWRPEAITRPDLLASVLELGIVAGASVLLARRHVAAPA